MRRALTIGLALAALAGRGAAQSSPSSTASGAELFEDRCAMCHVDGGGGQGPSLAGVVGRRAGAVADFGYSPALKASGLVWTPANLDRFLADPAKLVAGTAMPIHVPEASIRQSLIGYLASKR